MSSISPPVSVTTLTRSAADARTLPAAVTVYIVEDDPAVRSALQLLVRSHGWKPAAFASGLQFLARAPIEERACLVLDLNMPEIDGEEVLRRLRAGGSRLPVLVITGDREGPRLERLMRGGAHSVLLKPFGDAAFQAAVEDCLQIT
ncbi:MAG: two component transcriptional regulator, LuxR family [Hydrocarboniphaga sp.]|uniref:response regulator transcription factor n=1 Tax=Hydrocarboniphaga sp. TaxID=2033016 RepID=UPI00263A04C8|nr:response regulator [Hydrocarboniphaga sp.]MDB5971346.1 two component transcriptional regulator, LuxR family [Hydrocarboniphaga sp.]